MQTPLTLKLAVVPVYEDKVVVVGNDGTNQPIPRLSAAEAEQCVRRGHAVILAYGTKNKGRKVRCIKLTVPIWDAMGKGESNAETKNAPVRFGQRYIEHEHIAGEHYIYQHREQI